MGYLDDEKASDDGSQPMEVIELEVPKLPNVNANDLVHPIDLEPAARRKKRYISIWIVHAGMAIFSLGFSIVITGVLPYMKRLLPTTNEEDPDQLTFLYGIVVSMNPLGQMICSPLSGIISNKLKSIRLVCIVTSGMYIAGNLLYAILTVFPEDARLAIVLTGIASANNANMRSYVASSTYQIERTTQMSISSSMQSLGFIIGPAIQAAITPLKCEDVPLDELDEPYFTIDMFTLAGWISVVFGVVSLIMFMPGIFIEYDVSGEERQYNAALKGEVIDDNASDSQEEVIDLPDPDYLAVTVCVIAFFFYLFNFIIVETLGTPMAMDEFGWEEDKAILWLGVAMSVGGTISMFGFLSVGKLARMYDERLMMIFLGIIPMFISRILMLPFPNTESPKTPDDVTTPSATTMETIERATWDRSNFNFFHQMFMFLPNTYGYSGPSYHMSSTGMARERVECDEGGAEYCIYDWCDEFPGIMKWQFFLGVILTFVCYPFCLAIVQALFSKVLGPRPQGFWMGVLTAAGSLARFLGPIFVTTIYTNFGPYLSIGLVAATMVVTMALVLLVFRRLVPLGDSPEAKAQDAQDTFQGTVKQIDSDSE